MITEACLGKHLPVAKKNGTPFHLPLLINSLAAMNVSVVDLGAIFSSSK